MSKYKTIDLSSYKTVAIESVRFIGAELDNLEKSCIQASDVLNCISVGISTALNDRIPYKDTPILIETIGAFGIGKTTGNLPSIPYAGITMAGICWGINGSLAMTKAREESIESKIETERMACVLDGFKTIENRIGEGETLLYSLSEKLKKSLDALQSLSIRNEEPSQEAAKEIEKSIQLVKSIKQVIETDICNADGFLSRNSGVIFRKIEQEVRNV